MFRLVVFSVLVMGLLLGLAKTTVDAQEYRTWRDSTGRFSVEAALVERDGEMVILQSRDGRKINVPIERLSRQDRVFLSEIDAPGASAGTVGNDETSSILGITPNWDVQITPRPLASPAEQAVVSLPDRKSIVETFAIKAANPVAGRALISSVYSERRGGGPQITRLQLLDYTAGQLVYQSSLAGAWKPLALSNDGLQVLLTDIPKPRESSAGKLVLASLEEESVGVETEWIPYSDVADPTDEELIAELKQREPTMSSSDKARLRALLRTPSASSRRSSLARFRPPASRPIRFAEFMGDHGVVTLNLRGMLRFWRIADQTLIKQMDYPGTCQAALSPDRRHLALGSFSSVAVIDIEHPDHFAMQSLPGRSGSVRIAFSPSGQRLVVSPLNQLFVLDVGNGEVIHAGSLHLAGANRAIEFVSEDMLLVDHTFLYDFETQTFPWIYPDATCYMAGGSALWMAKNKPDMVVIDRLPSAEVTSRLREFVTSPEFQIIKPGFEAMIDLADIPTGVQRDVQRRIETAIQKAGGKTVPRSELVVKCFVNPPQTRRLAYILTGTHDVPVIECGVSLLVDGDERWRRVWDNVPSSVERLSHAETTARLIQACKTPDLSPFESVHSLPKKLQRTPDGPPVTPKINAFGRSRLTDRGWQKE
jgi:hypothetical protein